MSTTSTIILLGITGLAGAWWLFGRKSYFVELKSPVSGHGYEYFDDLGAARAFARKHSGAKLYQIRAGGEFDKDTAVQMTPNRSKRKRKAARRRR